ncbi:hypothetical protein BGZ73_006142 [Actinomortierella ambigua]|nr:hypothetical protein BGZ73_006142 [Actinomortierella ambigua]
MGDHRAILENVFGMLGIVFWSLQLLPQAWDNYRTKQVEGLSTSMFFIWTVAALGFGSYAIVENLSIPIIVQPQIFGVLSAICFLQCLYYTKNPRWKCSLRTITVGGVLSFVGMAAIEAGAYFATKAGLEHGVQGTRQAAGILPVVILGLGFFPQYFDIYRDRSVVSVSMLFIAGDALGSVFSIISLAFRDEFDLLAAMNYVMVLVCDLIVVVFWVYYNKLHPELSRVPPVEKGKQEFGSDLESVDSFAVSARAPPTVVSEAKIVDDHSAYESKETVINMDTVNTNNKSS